MRTNNQGDRMSRRQRRTGRTLFISSILVAALLGCKGDTPSYRTDPVSLGDIQQAVTATGTVNAVTTVQVGTQVSGTIKTLYVDFNSRVTKGQLIAQIDPSTFVSHVQQAQ
jgi:multidrug efflux pump subunit AcrA (membrane-fusion protein)